MICKILFVNPNVCRNLSNAYCIKVHMLTCISLQQEWCSIKQVSTYKSDNLQCNVPGCWVSGTNDLSTKRLMFQALFSFHNFLQNSFPINFLIFYNLTKNWNKEFWVPYKVSIRNNEKNNAWNIRCLDELFSPSPSKPAYYSEDCRISRWLIVPCGILDQLPYFTIWWVIKAF